MRNGRLPTLRYCRNNVPLDVRRRLRKSGFPVIEECCLDCCDVCYVGPYLLADGEIITGDSHLDILEMLKARSRC